MTDELTSALAELTAARQRLEALMADHSGGVGFVDPSLVTPPRHLQARFAAVVEMDRVREEEAAAEKAVAPRTEDAAAEVLAAAFAAARQSSDEVLDGADD